MMKRILYTVFCLLILTGYTSAQKLTSYELQLPSTILQGVNKMGLVSYETQEEAYGFASTFSDDFNRYMNSTGYGMPASKLYFNPWMHAKMLATNVIPPQSRDEATNVQKAKANGDQALMIVSVEVTEKFDRQKKEEKKKSLEGIPYKRVSYELKQDVTVIGTAKIVKTEDGSLLKEWNINSTKTSNEKVMDYPKIQKLKSPQALSKEIAVDIRSQFVNMLKAKFVAHKYDFKNIRRIKNKEVKALDKTVVKMLKKTPKENLKNIYAKMMEMDKLGFEEDKNTAKHKYNLGLLHEMVGNYEKAKAYYAEAIKFNAGDKDYKKALAHIEELLKVKKTFEAQGLEVKEYTF